MPRSASLIVLLLAAGCAAKTVPPAVTIAPLPAAPQASVAAPDPEPPKVPANYVRMTVAGVVPQSQGAAVALLDPTEATVVPIYVGGTEAMSIQQRSSTPRTCGRSRTISSMPRCARLVPRSCARKSTSSRTGRTSARWS